MTKIAYTHKSFTPAHMEIIRRADAICNEYQRKGYALTLRQLYYQYVQRGWLPNTQQNYNKLKGIVTEARRNGLLSWTMIEDRGRNRLGDMDGVAPMTVDEMFREAAAGYYEDLWVDQPRRIEVWVEKESLIEFVANACRGLRVTHFACKGYVSDSEMWRAGRRLARYSRQGREPLILHLGDHDPSGIDMTRDIQERLAMFGEMDIEIQRIALNMDQIEQYDPPPNPTKITDSRYHGYTVEYGFSSWELDSLNPEDMVELIQNELRQYMDDELWRAAVQREADERERLTEMATQVADRWDEIEQWLEDNPVD